MPRDQWERGQSVDRSKHERYALSPHGRFSGATAGRRYYVVAALLRFASRGGALA